MASRRVGSTWAAAQQPVRTRSWTPCWLSSRQSRCAVAATAIATSRGPASLLAAAGAWRSAAVGQPCPAQPSPSLISPRPAFLWPAPQAARQPKRRRKKLHDLSGVGSVGITARGPLDKYRFNACVKDLLGERARDIFRCKGVLCIKVRGTHGLD